jgi:transposase
MGKPYSDDLRERVVAAIEAGQTRVQVANLYNMALSTVGGFIKRKRETGRVSPFRSGRPVALRDRQRVSLLSSVRRESLGNER